MSENEKDEQLRECIESAAMCIAEIDSLKKKLINYGFLKQQMSFYHIANAKQSLFKIVDVIETESSYVQSIRSINNLLKCTD